MRFALQKKLKKQQKMQEWQRIKEEKQRAEQEAEVPYIFVLWLCRSCAIAAP